MATDITSIINQHINAAQHDASIVDKLDANLKPSIMGALL